MPTFELKKFDVAERQLLQAITMFFREEDPISIHTLSEAAAQILSDIGKKHGVTSLIRTSDIIKKEHKKEWLTHVHKSKNFFKHGDNDADSVHLFKEEYNHYSLLDATHMYIGIKKAQVPETLCYTLWFGLAHPNLVIKGTFFSEKLKQSIESNIAPNPKNRNYFSNYIKATRDGAHPTEGLNLKYGL